MSEDPSLHEALERLPDVELHGLPHVHCKEEVRAMLFGGPPPEQKLGRFTVLGELGRGGMGVVLHARDDQLDRELAIKLMKEDLRSAHGKRLLREAQALAKLTHPNVVQVYEVGTAGDRVFIAMQLIEGVTLDEWQKETRTWSECTEVYLQAGRGLAAAHAAGLIHRDFKPSNCMLDTQGTVRVLDFGLAREQGVWLDDGTSPMNTEESGIQPSDGDSLGASASMLRQRLTETGSFMGTRAFMAPEQLAQMYADSKSDQWSFCVALYEALYGQRPFCHDSPSVLLEMAEGVPHRPLPPANAEVPRWLRRIILRGLSAQPEDRWPSMDALLDELERRRRPSRWRWVAGAAVLLGAGLGLGASSPWSLDASLGSSCDEATRPLIGLWGAPQRDAVRRALLASEHDHARHTWSVVNEQIDHHVRTLWDEYRDACESSARDPSSLDHLRSRRACLEDRRIDLRDRIIHLASLEPHQVDQAAEFIAYFPPIGRCERTGALLGATDPEADALRQQLGNARHFEQLGRYDDGLANLEPLLPRLEASGSEPLWAEGLLLSGMLHAGQGDTSLAIEHLQRAHQMAIGSAADSTAVEAIARLVYLVGVDQAQTEAALWLGSTAEALATRPTVDPLRHAEILTSMAQVRTVRGDHARALRDYRLAIELLEQRWGPSHIALADVLDSHGTASDGGGNLDQAEDSYRRALAIREHWQGPMHPDTAYQRVQLGVLLARRGRRLDSPEDEARAADYYQQAVEQYLRALAVFNEAAEPDQRRLAHVRSNLGVAYELLGQPGRAERQLRRAIEHWTLAHGPVHPRVAAGHFNLAAVLEPSRPAEAIESYDRAIESLLRGEATPQGLSRIDKTLSRLERLLVGLGDRAGALARYRDVLTRLEPRDIGPTPALSRLRERHDALLHGQDAPR